MESARGCRPGWRSRVWPKRSLSPVGGGPVGSAGGGFDAQGAHVLHQAAGDSAPAGVEGRAVVGQQALGHAPGGYALVEDVDGRLAGHRPGRPARPPPGASGRPGAGQITALRPPARTYSVASSCQQALGAGRVEPAPRRPRSLGRFGPGHPLLTEDPGQGRRRGRLEAHGGHPCRRALIGPWSSPERPRSRAHIEGPGANPIGQAARAGIADGATGARPPPRAPPPGARRRKTQERPCARCPARRQTSSPPRGARHRAIGRSPDGHGDQHCGSYRGSPLNPKPRVSPPGPAEPSPMS